MKQIAIIILVTGCTLSTFAGDRVTPEFKTLQMLRTKKIKEIDTAYINALKKLKLKCTKKNDLVSVNAIDAELKNIETGQTPEQHINNTDSSNINHGSESETESQVVGRWKTVDFVNTMDQFSPSKKYWKGDLFLLELDFHKRGYVMCSNKKVDEYQQDWIKGKVDPDSEHPAHYYIKEIKGETYLFFEWISGDVTERGKKPSFYVLKKK